MTTFTASHVRRAGFLASALILAVPVISVAAALNSGARVATPQGTCYSVTPERVYDSRPKTLNSGEVISIDINEPTATKVTGRLGVDQTNGGGYLTAWSGDVRPPTASVNWVRRGDQDASWIEIAAVNGTFKVYTSSPAAVIFDLYGYCTDTAALPPVQAVPATVPVATVPVTTVPVTTVVPRIEALVPAMSQVGPRGTLTERTGGVLAPGTYSSVRFTSTIQLQPGAYTFTDADILGIVSRYAGYIAPGSPVRLSHSVVRSGLWFEDGGHNGWVIDWSLLDGGSMQAVRPKGAGSITISDSILSTHGTSADPALGIHTESMQMLSGASGTFTRVAFSVEPRWNGSYTPITGVVNVSEAATTTTFADSEFGYLNGTTWSQGGGYYAIYPGPATFIRPVIHAPQAGSWYQVPVSTRLVSPTYC